MCARIQQNQRTLKPGDKLLVTFPNGSKGWSVWNGFARSESLQKWEKQQDSIKVAIPCETFAERHDTTRALVWENLPKPKLLSGIIAKDFKTHQRGVRIITQEASPQELQHFGHHRVPVTL
jgi:hypothetical protein